MLADKKKCQSLLNAMALAAEQIQAADARLDSLYAKFTAASPDVTGTPLAGNLTTLNNWRLSVKSLAENATTTALINYKVNSHQGQALEQEG